LFLHLVVLSLCAGEECGEVEVRDARVDLADFGEHCPETDLPLNSEPKHFERFERAEACAVVTPQLELSELF